MRIDRSSPLSEGRISNTSLEKKLDLLLGSPATDLPRLDIDVYLKLTSLALCLVDPDESKTDTEKLADLKKMTPAEKAEILSKFMPALAQLKSYILTQKLSPAVRLAERIHPPISKLESTEKITRTLLRKAIKDDHFARFRKGRLACLEGNANNEYGDLRWHSLALAFAHKYALNTKWVLNVLLAIQLIQSGVSPQEIPLSLPVEKPASSEEQVDANPLPDSVIESAIDLTQSAVANIAPCSTVDVRADQMHVSADGNGYLVIRLEAEGNRPVLIVRTSIKNAALSFVITHSEASSA